MLVVNRLVAFFQTHRPAMQISAQIEALFLDNGDPAKCENAARRSEASLVFNTDVSKQVEGPSEHRQDIRAR